MMAAYAVVGLPARMLPLSKSPFTVIKGAVSRKTCTEDIFFSALSSLKAKDDVASLSFGVSFGFPRVAIAGAEHTNFASRMREICRGQFRMICSDNQNKRKREDNPFSEETYNFLNKRLKLTNSDVLDRPVGDHENSYGQQGDVSHGDTLDLTAAAELFERLTPKEDFGKLKHTLPLALQHRLKKLSEMEPTTEVGLEIVDSVYLLMLLGSSNSNFNSAGKKASRGAMMLQKGMKLLMEGQNLLRSTISDT